jgi:hypothetical protein
MYKVLINNTCTVNSSPAYSAILLTMTCRVCGGNTGIWVTEPQYVLLSMEATTTVGYLENTILQGLWNMHLGIDSYSSQAARTIH